MFTKGPVQVFPQGEELQLQARALQVRGTSSVTILTHLCMDHEGLCDLRWGCRCDKLP